MDEVVGGVNALQRPVQRRRIKNVPLHDLGSRLHMGSELVGISGETAELHALPFQQGDQPPADVTAAASEQDDRLVGSSRRSASLRKPTRCGSENDRQLPIMISVDRAENRVMTDRGANDGLAATTFDRDDP